MQKQFKGACNVCGKIGHKGADCFTLIRNKDKKEAYLKKTTDIRTEKEAEETETSREKFTVGIKTVKMEKRHLQQ